MGNKQHKGVSTSTSVLPTSSTSLVQEKNNRNYLNYLPNEILFCIFDYLLPIDIVRAFQYDLQRFNPLIREHLCAYGLNFARIHPKDTHLISLCLSLIEQQHLSIGTKDSLLSTVLQFVPSPTTLTVVVNTSFRRSFLSTVPPQSLTCAKLIIEYVPDDRCQMNEIDIIPLLSSSVTTLILRNVVFYPDQSPMGAVCNSLRHIRCVLDSESHVDELLRRFPELVSIDIRLLTSERSVPSTALTLPKNFRIEYPSETILNIDQFPPLTSFYDQTVYSPPWFESNSSLILRSCDPNNYLNSFPSPLPSIRRLIIQCSFSPWSSEFVTFLRQTFPNTRTLYAIQEDEIRQPILTIITAKDRRKRRCTLIPSPHKTSITLP